MGSTQDESSALHQTLMTSLETSFRARQSLKALAAEDSATVSPQDLHERLLATRRVVDVLEYELVSVIMARSRIEALRAHHEETVEEAEVTNAPAETRGEYMSARDRSIDINTRTISQRRSLRVFNRLAEEAKDSVRAVQEMHRGADGYRREIDTRIRALNLTTMMER